jgi:hypothetical protein
VGTQFEGKKLTIQGQILVTHIGVEINLMEPAQELDCGKHVLLDPKMEL